MTSPNLNVLQAQGIPLKLNFNVIKLYEQYISDTRISKNNACHNDCEIDNNGDKIIAPTTTIAQLHYITYIALTSP